MEFRRQNRWTRHETRTDGIARAPEGGVAPMWRIATPDELGRALEAGVIVKADLATAPTVTGPVAGTYVAVRMPPSAFVSVSR